MNERLPDMQARQLDAEDGADVWIVRRESGRQIESDPEFVKWLAADPANAVAWRRGLAAWERAQGDNADPFLEAMRRDALMARPARAMGWPLKAAAGIAALILIVVLVGRWTPSPSNPKTGEAWVSASASADFSNGAALPKTISLPDGAQVTLDADTAIAVAYERSRRGVRLLRGRAYFDVPHDPKRPFQVAINDRQILDLGTQFSVRLKEDNVGVMLISGSVSVAVPNLATPTVLKPGEMMVIPATGVDPTVSAFPPDAMAWRDGFLVFRDMPLAAALAEVNRYGGQAVTARDVGDLRITGQYRVGDPIRFARSLTALHPLKLDVVPGGEAVLSRR